MSTHQILPAMHKKITLTAVFLVLCFTGETDAQFNLNGEFRPRSEYRHGFQSLMNPNENAAFFISQRTRINADFREDNYSFGFSLQDIRVWGEVPQLNRTDFNSSVHEAWAELRISDNSSIKAGRQEIIYDNSRIFGNVDWAQQGRSHDAAIIKLAGEGGLLVNAGFAFNQESERNRGTFYNLNNYKTFQYIWINNKWQTIEASFLLLNNGMQHSPDRTVFSQTTGARALYSPGSSSLSAAVYLQSGKDVFNRTLSAYYIALHYELPIDQTASLNAGFELLSGTNQADMQNPAINRNNSFTPLYGTNHMFNGHMDYFYVGNHIDNVGLRDIYGGLTINPGKWSGGFRIHVFTSDALLNDPGSPGETMPRYLGTELDVFAGFSLYQAVTLRIGYSQMFASESMEVLKGGSRNEISNWGWLMLILKPQLIK